MWVVWPVGRVLVKGVSVEDISSSDPALPCRGGCDLPVRGSSFGGTLIWPSTLNPIPENPNSDLWQTRRHRMRRQQQDALKSARAQGPVPVRFAKAKSA